MIFLFLLLGVLSAQNNPEWVDQMPIDTSYYWARENVGISGLSEEEYKTKANQQALFTLSTRIKSEVSGSSIDVFRETNNDVYTDFIEESYFSTAADIKDSEMFGEYKSMTTYWVLFRLNKKTHRKNSKRHLEYAKGQYEFFKTLDDTQPVKQLQSLIPAYEDVKKVVGQNVIYGQGINLKTEIPNEISRIVNSLRLVPGGATSLVGKVGWAIDEPLKIKVKASKNISTADIPIKFQFYNGEGTFSESMVTTSREGRAKTEVTRLISRARTQRIRASIDLNQWRESRSVGSNKFTKELNKISEANSVSFVIDVSEVTQEKIAIITVGDTSVYTESDLKRLNRRFRSDFVNITEFKLTDESIIENIIEKYKRSATLCSNEQCQIDIGNALKVKELMFIDVADYPKQIAVTLFLRNISEGSLNEKSYYFNHNGKISKEDKLQIIDENITDMVEDFWIRYNPALVTITTPGRRGIRAKFKFNNPTQWMESDFERRLPMFESEIFEGDYYITISNPGFEEYEESVILDRGEFVELNINLIEKTPAKAFWKSMIIPGRGQIYSSSLNTRSRAVVGYVLMASSVGITTLMGSAWGDYSNAKSEYDDANEEYLKQKLIEDVQVHRSIAEEKNSLMLDKQTTALVFTGLWSMVWIGGALEAMFNFPQDKNQVSSSIGKFDLSLDPKGGYLESRINYNIPLR